MANTVRQWFETIEDKEVKEKALRNINMSETYPFPEVICETHASAIQKGFSWRFTEEGYEYWDNICKQYEKLNNYD